MASRRKLKKCVYYVATSIIQEAIVLNSIIDFSDTKMDSIINDTVTAYRDIMLKINNPEGTDNPKEIKKYYNTIIGQFQTEVNRIIKELE